MPTMTSESRREWLTDGEKATEKEIWTGCLQRLTVAIESMSKGFSALEQERDRYKRWYEEEQLRTVTLQHRLRGLKGALTRRRKQKP